MLTIYAKAPELNPPHGNSPALKATRDLDAVTIVPQAIAQSTDDSGEAALPTIPGYEVLRELGRGGMGVVYLARQVALQRMVALKTIASNNVPRLAELLLTEAHIASRLNHPAIVPVYEANTDAEPWYFSMGLVAGVDLAQRLSSGVLTVQQTVDLAVTICGALQHAHELGICHLDIKPANILLDRDSRPKLTDFGLSAVHRSELNARAIIGTPQFMSPEQALGATEDVGVASDIYSLGAVMYAALAGRPPLVSANPQELILQVVSQPPPRFRELGIAVPKPLESIIRKCLQKKPAQRYATIQLLQEDLAAFDAGQPVKARPPGWISTMDYYLRRNVMAATVSGSVVFLLMVAIGLLLLRSWTLTSQLETLQGAYDRLDNVASLQSQLMRGRINRNSLVSQLFDSGDLESAALFAAWHLSDNPEAAVPDVIKEVLAAYAKRHPAAEPETETHEQLVARIIQEAPLAKSSTGRNNREAPPIEPRSTATR